MHTHQATPTPIDLFRYLLQDVVPALSAPAGGLHKINTMECGGLHTAGRPAAATGSPGVFQQRRAGPRHRLAP